MYKLLYADSQGRMYDHPRLMTAGRSGGIFTEMVPGDAIPLPEGASLVLIPEGRPIGQDRKGNFTVYSDRRQGPVFAVGALLPQGYTRTLLPAYVRESRNPLPLFGYAAVGLIDDQIYVAAIKTDEDRKWNPAYYSTPELEPLVRTALSDMRNNRIIRQLAQCAVQYRCFTAQNIFYQRWEGGIPVSPACNARCLGCISLQPAECCPSPQSRIDFKPTVEEIVEVALPHLDSAPEGIISFGQGCEGEPSLAADTVAEAILHMRRKTKHGTVNMNTNAGNTEGIKRICRAGIDSLRVSTVSARRATYSSYYLPRDYLWQDVCESIACARSENVYVSLNLLTFPGLTDIPEETAALVKFIKEYDVNMVQIRNLNIDPDYLAAKVPLGGENALGIQRLVEILQTEIPGLEMGNYTRPRRFSERFLK